jgi:long-chain acyl-CoA synthetase
VLGVNQPGDVMMIILPMFHTNPLCVWTYPTILRGIDPVHPQSLFPSDFWPAIIRYGVTTVQGVPAMYDYVYQRGRPLGHRPRASSKLRLAYTGAAPMPVPLIDGLQGEIRRQVIDGYGLTEATGVSTTGTGVPRVTGSIGTAFPGLEVEIMDNGQQHPALRRKRGRSASGAMR